MSRGIAYLYLLCYNIDDIAKYCYGANRPAYPAASDKWKPKGKDVNDTLVTSDKETLTADELATAMRNLDLDSLDSDEAVNLMEAVESLARSLLAAAMRRDRMYHPYISSAHDRIVEELPIRISA